MAITFLQKEKTAGFLYAENFKNDFKNILPHCNSVFTLVNNSLDNIR